MEESGKKTGMPLVLYLLFNQGGLLVEDILQMGKVAGKNWRKGRNKAEIELGRLVMNRKCH